MVSACLWRTISPLNTILVFIGTASSLKSNPLCMELIPETFQLELGVATGNGESCPVIWATKILSRSVHHLLLRFPECFNCWKAFLCTVIMEADHEHLGCARF